jgi:hypothetical protein
MTSRLAAALLLVLGVSIAKAQCDTIATLCERHITKAYIPDGQVYRALLYEDETAEFDATLFGGTTYRVAGCSGLSDGNLIFSVFDKERNLLFTNRDHNNDPYWDLAITNTLDVIVEATLDVSKVGSGCGVLLIGFRR